MHDHNPPWLIPDWPAPPGIQALCSTRGGGVSVGRYDAMNLGLHVGDDPVAVTENRRRLQQALGVRPVFLAQVHGSVALALSAQIQDGAQADAAWTTEPDLACTVMVADCLPVLLCDAAGQRIAAAHAGWRGLLGAQGLGVLESALLPFMQGTGPAADVLAWLGPCIGPQAFEVGEEVRSAFVSDNAQAADCFTPLGSGKWLADLAALARQRLHRLGVTRVFGNDGSAPWCTVANPSRFFSHRRDGVSGRMAACIWRRA